MGNGSIGRCCKKPHVEALNTLNSKVVDIPKGETPFGFGRFIAGRKIEML
jgi:hypothetical protein